MIRSILWGSWFESRQADMGELIRRLERLVSKEQSNAPYDKDFFDLQLQFADKVRQLTPGMSPEEAIARFTNIPARLGLGVIPHDSTDPRWRRYVAGLRDAGGHEMPLHHILDWTDEQYRAHLDAMRKESKTDDEMFGPFFYDYSPETRSIDIHFRRIDAETVFDVKFFTEGRRHLTEMFSKIKLAYPDALEVEGTSWLFDNQRLMAAAMRFKLFPRSFKPNQAEPPRTAFTALGLWGQFVDKSLKTNLDLKRHFEQNLRTVTLDNLYEAFPFRRLRAKAPIADFYKLFEIE